MIGGIPLPIRLLIGLGNPGERYRRTRHNAGFLVLERLEGFRQTRWQPGYGGRWAEALLDGCPAVLFKPGTYMNLSGDPVARILSRGFSPGEILVLCDDLDLPLGRIRLKPSGGTGGHRGLASISDALGTGEYPRLRIGIGRPQDGGEPRDYVLDGFAEDETEVAGAALDLAARAAVAAVADGVEIAMNEFNGIDVAAGEP